MNGRSLTLHPHPSTASRPDIAVACDIARRSNKLAVRYEIIDNIEGLLMPALTEASYRKNGLWEETCLELFLGVRDSPRYWEFNFSPAGYWNVFRFAAYREGMQEEGAFQSLPFRAENLPGSFLMTLGIDLDEIIREEQPLDAGISAVVKKRDGEASYWALSHPGPRPDFHRRDSFIIEL